MRLPKDKSFAGLTALQVRSLLRKLAGGKVTRDQLACTLQLPRRGAQTLLDLLVAEGLLAAAEPSGWYGTGVLVGAFEVTIAGAAFAQASVAPPLHRRTVERRLRELVGRMVEINAKSEFLVGIEEAYVYGSYLSAAERLGDLDISLSFYRKDPARFMELAKQAAHESARRFGSYLEELFWPETQAKLYLKQRSRVFSIHQDEPLLKDPNVPRLAIFAARQPTLRRTEDGHGQPMPQARPGNAQ